MIFALLNATSSKIIKGIKINNIQVSGLTKPEAEEKLESIVENIMRDKIILKHDDYETEITLKQIELDVNIQEKVFDACTIGRNKNIIYNNYKILSTMLFGENIDFDFKYNDKIVKSVINTLADEWDDKFVDNGYYIEDDKLIIVKGKEGAVIDEEKLIQEIKNIAESKIQVNKRV